jgi:hypothetical protein
MNAFQYKSLLACEILTLRTYLGLNPDVFERHLRLVQQKPTSRTLDPKEDQFVRHRATPNNRVIDSVEHRLNRELATTPNFFVESKISLVFQCSRAGPRMWPIF